MEDESLKLKKARQKMNDALGLKESNSITPEPKLKTKKQKNKAKKRVDKITRRVERKYDSGDLSTTENMAAARTKEGNLIDTRKQKRKDYLVAFANELAPAEQSGQYKGAAFGKGPKPTSSEASIAGAQAAVDDKRAETAKNEQQYSDIFKGLQDVSNDKLLNNFSYDTGVSGLNKNTDSNPSSFMKKEYFKKRGY